MNQPWRDSPISVPPSPGSVLRAFIGRHAAMRQADLARALGISAVRVSQIMNNKAPITPGVALRLARVLGKTPEYWLQLQTEQDLFRARERLKDRLDRLPRLVSTPLMRLGK